MVAALCTAHRWIQADISNEDGLTGSNDVLPRERAGSSTGRTSAQCMGEDYENVDLEGSVAVDGHLTESYYPFC